MGENPSESAGRGGTANALLAVSGNLSTQLTSLIVTLVAAAFLTTEDYGVYALAVVFVEFIVMITYTGYFHFVVNSPDDDETVLSSMFWIMLAIGVIGGGALIVAASSLAAYFRAPELAKVLSLMGMMQPFASMIGWASAALMRMGRMRRYFISLILQNSGGLLAGCMALLVWHSVYALVFYRGFQVVLGLGLFVLAVPHRPKLRVDVPLVRQASRYASGLYGSRFVGFLSMYGTDLMLASLFSVSESGLYRLANRIAMGAVDVVGQPMRTFMLKRFGQASRRQESLDGIFADYLGAALFLAGGVASVIVVLGQPAMRMMFSPEYLAAAGALQALAIRAAALTGNNMIEPVFAARPSTRPASVHNFFWFVALLATVVLASRYGLVALASAQAVLALLTSLGAFWVIARWGRVDVRTGMLRSAMALVLAAVYALMLGVGWHLIQGHLGLTSWSLAAGLALAVGLALPVTAVAMRLKVLSMGLFVD